MSKAFLIYFKQEAPVFLTLALCSSLLLFFLLSTIHSIAEKQASWKKDAIISAVLLAAVLMEGCISPIHPLLETMAGALSSSCHCLILRV